MPDTGAGLRSAELVTTTALTVDDAARQGGPSGSAAGGLEPADHQALRPGQAVQLRPSLGELARWVLPERARDGGCGLAAALGVDGVLVRRASHAGRGGGVCADGAGELGVGSRGALERPRVARLPRELSFDRREARVDELGQPQALPRTTDALAAGKEREHRARERQAGDAAGAHGRAGIAEPAHRGRPAAGPGVRGGLADRGSACGARVPAAALRSIGVALEILVISRPGRHRWIRRALLGALATAASACDRSPAEPPAEPGPPGDAGLVATPDAPAADAGAARALTEIRAGTLRVAPARSPAQLLAIGRGRLARITAGGVELRELGSSDAGAPAEVPLAGSRRVVALPDGSLLALGRDGSLWFGERRRAAVSVGRVSLFPEAVVLPDLADAARLWVAPGFGATLFPYALDPKRGALHLAAEGALELPDHDGRALGVTRDGTMLFSVPDGLALRPPRGRAASLKLAGVDVSALVRVLPAARVDQAVFVHADGRAVVAQVAPTPRVARTLQLPGEVRDVATGGDRLAVVHVEQGKGRPRVWRLSVLDLEGHALLDAPLGEDGPDLAGADWEARVTGDRNVVVSGDGAHVAVGGRTSVAVWSVPGGPP